MGTKEGAKKASITNRLRYGDDFYKIIGSRGGQRGVSGGFACLERGADGLTGPERARIVGAKGGSISRRGPAKQPTKIMVEYVA